MNTSTEAEFAEFVRSRWRDLVRAAVFLGATPHEAEDLAQQTLVRCFAAWERVSGARNTDAYVYRMLLNQLRDLRRTRWSRSRIDATVDPSIDDSTDHLALHDALERALGALTKDQRDVVVLRYFVQLSELETSKALGIAAGTVKSRLSRALAQLSTSAHLSDLAREHL